MVDSTLLLEEEYGQILSSYDIRIMGSISAGFGSTLHQPLNLGSEWYRPSETIPTSVPSSQSFDFSGSCNADDSIIVDFDEAVMNLKMTPVDDLIEEEEELGNQKKKQKIDDGSSRLSKSSYKWTELGEIFLTGIVMDIYYRRHSLKPKQLDFKVAENEGSNMSMLVWKEICHRYNTARERFYDLTGRQILQRSAQSLQRHWKESGEKREVFLSVQHEYPKTKMRERDWDMKYNKYYLLSCSDKKYQECKARPDLISSYREALDQ